MASLLALLTASPSHAAIDAQLNTSNFVSGQASEISIDGIVTSGGPSTGIIAAALVLRYDTAQVTVSGLRAGSGWGLEASNQTTTDGGWVKAVLTNMSGNGAGQTATGPILYFTVTPANGQVDVDDCHTLRFAGVESDLADQGFEQIYPSDPCEGRMAPVGSDGADNGTAWRGGFDPMDDPEPEEYANACGFDLPNATRALRIVGGLSQASPADVALYDLNYDGRVALPDAIAVLRSCPNRTANIYFTDRNSTASPAVAPVSSGGFPVIVFTGDYSDPPSDDPRCPYTDPPYAHSPFYWPNTWPENAPFRRNYNIVCAAGWQGDFGWGIQPGWPQGTRDWATGVTIGNLLGPKILAMNHQDWLDYFEPPDAPDPGDRTAFSQEYSRLYVWGPEAESVEPWAPGPDRVHWTDPEEYDLRNPTQLFSESGVGNGHSYAAPVVFDAVGAGSDQVVMASIGVQNSTHLGQIQIFDAAGATMLATQPRNPGLPGDDFYSYNTWADSAFYTPPVFARPSLLGRRDLVAATHDGKVYRWRLGYSGGVATADAVSGWFPKTSGNQNPVSKTEENTILYYPLAAADVNGDGSDEVIGATGRMYSAIPRGRVYCWNADGSERWKWPDTTAFTDNFTSGIAVGHLRGPNDAVSIVVGDATGRLKILHLSSDVPPEVPGYVEQEIVVELLGEAFPHLYDGAYPFDSIVAQPVIGDVDGDGIQEIVVGGYDGYVNALRADGSIVWRVAMPKYIAPSQDLSGPVQFAGTHLMTVTGIALASLKNDGHLNVIVTCSALVISVAPDYPRKRQMLILDCGPNTYDSGNLDWPQFQQNAQRTRFLP